MPLVEKMNLRIRDIESRECRMTLLSDRTNQLATVDLRNNRILWPANQARRLLRGHDGQLMVETQLSSALRRESGGSREWH